MWVTRVSLTSPESIAALVRSARASGFNTLLVQVRGRGDAYFADGLEPRADGLAAQRADFDPLQTVITRARAEGLRVHAWVNVNLVASAAELPAGRGHIVYRHPEWLMVPKPLAVELARAGSRSPEFLGRLARWTRAAEEVEGLFASPGLPDAAAHTVAVIDDLVARYPVDGVHLDYLRYPGPEFDYNLGVLREFRADLEPQLPEAERRRLRSSQRRRPDRADRPLSGALGGIPPLAPQRAGDSDPHRGEAAPARRRAQCGRLPGRDRSGRAALSGLALLGGEPLARRGVPDGLHAGRERV